MNAYDTFDATVELFRPGAEPQQALLSLDAAADGEYWVVLRWRLGDAWQVLRKHPTPLSLDQARGLFARTVAAKLDDGFLGVASEVPAVDMAGIGLSESKLAALAAGIAPDNWRLLSARQRSRAAWRLGELRVAAAVPQMVALLGSGEAMLDYCLAWAIGRCGDVGAKAAMAELARAGRTEPIKRIAQLAWLQLANAEERTSYAARLVADWPAAKALCGTGQPSLLSWGFHRVSRTIWHLLSPGAMSVGPNRHNNGVRHA